MRTTNGRKATQRQVRGRVLLAGGKQTEGKFDTAVVVRTIKTRIRAIKACYERELRRDPRLRGQVTIGFTVQPRGNVTAVNVQQNSTRDDNVVKCVRNTVARFRFNPGPGTASTFRYTFSLSPEQTTPRPAPQVVAQPRPTAAELAAQRRQRAARRLASEMRREWETRPGPDPSGALEGKLLEVMVSADAGNTDTALTEAWRWRAQAPGDVLALLALGHALQAAGEVQQASRAYGSVIDLFPARADLRRMAGNFLERVALVDDKPAVAADALALATETYARARAQRPDHPASHRLYAFALVKGGEHAEAFAALREGYGRSYPAGRFAGAKEILADDLRIVASAWRAARPKDAEAIDAALDELDLKEDKTKSLRFVLSWETDANDVDFHLYDGKKGHAYYGRKELPNGGHLIADVTTGYGPECFRVDRPKAYPYEISAHYYARGPMGYGMGKVQVIKHDGRGQLTFDERPFVIMKDKAFIHLGVVEG